MYRFNPEEIDSIVNRFGKSFFDKVLRDMASYADKWSLTGYQLIPSYSSNLVFLCESAAFGSAVLKIGNPAFGEIVTEFHTLRQYDRTRLCKVFEADLDNSIILEERVRPGNPLRVEASLERRLAIFGALYQGLHQPPVHAEIYPTYTRWVSRITAYMSKREDCPELYWHMNHANEICKEVSATYPRQMLLHGDFHHDNILLGDHGEYTIIDPKGVVGDPVFDVPRFILNEFDDEITTGLYTKINEIIGVLEEKLQIPDRILRQCLYVETVMGACWSVEDGSTPEEYPRLLQRALFAETLLNN